LGFGHWATVSLGVFLLAAASTWRWFDADEFVNLQQAVRANAGLALYTQTPSNHPPFYVEPVLRALVALPGDDLVAARLASLLMTWGAGLLIADVWRRQHDEHAASVFLVLWTANAFVLLAGTRAMNEAPLLFLLALAYWLVVVPRDGLLAGCALALAVATRLTAFVYAPSLAAIGRRRLPAVGLATALVGGLLLLGYALRGSETLPALIEQAAAFQAQRDGESLARKLGKLAWWSSLPVMAAAVALVGRMPQGRHAAGAVGAVVLLPVMFLFPNVHLHYLLPLSIVATSAVTWAWLHLGTASDARRRALAAVALAVFLSQGVLYVPQTPNNDLDDANAVAAWIEQHTPASMAILTDAPQYAVLSGRANFDGYYWALRDTIEPERLTAAHNQTSVIVVSERFGAWDRGFPEWFNQKLEGLPCVPLETARAYWTGAAGDAPMAAAVGACTSVP
jgi:hypothetical protein